MDTYTITCSRCEAPVEHECQRHKEYDTADGDWHWRDRKYAYHPNRIINALVEFMIWRPEHGLPTRVVDAMKSSSWYDPDDESEPFMSQAVTYPLFESKDNARSFHALFGSIIEACGFSRHEVRRIAHRVDKTKQARRAGSSGHVAPMSDMASIDWMPVVGWSVKLIVPGVGTVNADITGSRMSRREGGPRGPWDWRVHFRGGNGWVSARRLIKIAVEIRDERDNVVWPRLEPNDVVWPAEGPDNDA